ncbi:MAG: hypothetical protein D6767_06085 [Candidatus Hydrogenedentota bacterium]|nr:MAG: hypothetical protein D6767_06085 [Candidatus Hydrogenedentota bacterium]
MQYFKSAQPVPGKGTAWTYYEADEEDNIQRILTFIDGTDEITLYPKPKIKKLIMKDRLFPASEEEFSQLWDQGS